MRIRKPVSVESPEASAVLKRSSVGLAGAPVCEGCHLVQIVSFLAAKTPFSSVCRFVFLSMHRSHSRRDISPLQSHSVAKLPLHHRRSMEANGHGTFWGFSLNPTYLRYYLLINASPISSAVGVDGDKPLTVFPVLGFVHWSIWLKKSQQVTRLNEGGD